ncbi:MAG: hypothetical protein JWP15_2087 [Alphaproteobacteria bacterium]|nr:hypothetical protein [Alphaproteobacteria bacterium]
MKGYGYLVSILSVLLLAVPSLKGAKDSPIMAACLVLGMAASIVGMGIRWVADLKQKAKVSEARSAARGSQSQAQEQRQAA